MVRQKHGVSAILGLFFSLSTMFAQEILVVTGGHDFDRPAFFEMFDSMPNVEWTEAVQPKAQKMLVDGSIDDYDVLVFYDMYEPIDTDTKKAFLKLLQKGKPMLFLHHSLVSYQNWETFREIIGGKYYDKKKLESVPDHTYSDYLHDTDIEIEILQEEHPVTTELDDFKVFDEVYGNTEVLPEVIPLLGTQHAKSTAIIGWEHYFGNSKILYLQPGHGTSIFSDENYRKLIYQALLYLNSP